MHIPDIAPYYWMRVHRCVTMWFHLYLWHPSSHATSSLADAVANAASMLLSPCDHRQHATLVCMCWELLFIVEVVMGIGLIKSQCST